MNHAQLVEAAKAAGVIRTDEQFAALTKKELQALIDEFGAMDEDQKSAANKAAEESEGDESAKSSKGNDSKSNAKSAKLKKDLATVWKDYPAVKEVFATADGTLFFQKNAAENHQLHLKKDKSDIKKYERD